MMFSKANYIKSKKQKINQKREQKSYDKLQKSFNISPMKKSTTTTKVIVDLESDNKQSEDLIQIKAQSFKNNQFQEEDKQSKNEIVQNVGKNYEEQKNFINNSGKTANNLNVDINKNIINNTTERKFNNFNFDRIKKMSGLLRQNSKPAILGVQLQTRGIQQQVNENSKPISYLRSGVSKQNTISERYLKTRLQKFQQQLASIDAQETEKLLENQSNPVANKEPLIKRPPRYFDDQKSDSNDQKDSQNQDDEQQKKKVIKCYRCGQRGHIARLCNQKQTLKCVYCLGPHHTSDCNDKLCHRCNQKGHIKQQCRSEKIQCRRCRMFGHSSKNCGKIIMMNFKAEREPQIREKYDKTDLQKLKCLKCNGFRDSKGHFNCHKYIKRIPRIYEQPYIIE